MATPSGLINIEARHGRLLHSPRKARLSDGALRAVRQRGFRSVTMAASSGCGARVARPLITASCVGAALIALYSCSMQASVTTDGSGRIVELSSLRIGSKLSSWALEMLVVGGQLAVELKRARPGGTEIRTRNDCPVLDVSNGLIASA